MSVPQLSAVTRIRLAREAALHDAMVAFMLAHSFTRLELTLSVLRSEIAKEHRDRLAREGWVA